jgi:hypothetical protein
MVKVKMMNENMFAKLAKEYAALGEFIRTRQEEKQSVLDEFDKELVRYKKGNISENTLASSVKKTNVELLKLDKSVRETITKCNKYSDRIRELINKQKPIVYKAREIGVGLASSKKVEKKSLGKKVVKRKVSVKRRPVKKKVKITRTEISREMKAEKKLMK